VKKEETTFNGNVVIALHIITCMCVHVSVNIQTYPHTLARFHFIASPVEMDALTLFFNYNICFDPHGKQREFKTLVKVHDFSLLQKGIFVLIT
jgi:hypothetical protein